MMPSGNSSLPQTKKAVAGFRDTLIHGYFGVDLEILWDIVVHKIPLLEAEIDRIIAYEKKQV
jgi:uncharacterized protein with HEPN domain